MWKESILDIQKKAFKLNLQKEIPSEWIERNIFLPEGVSRYKGRFSYNISPYAREIVDHVYSGNPSRVVAVMKSAQIGLTQGLIIPAMAYVIAEDPFPMMFMAGDKELAKKSIEERFDPILQSSNLQHLIKPSVIRAKNQRTGDTSTSKEYAGGRLTIEGTQNVTKMRQISVKMIFADDWDSAPQDNKREGSIRKLMEGRQTSYGNLAKTFYVSTPTEKGASNIEEVYLLGDQRKWNWKCPHCDEWIVLEWIVKDENGNSIGGIIYELNEKKQLIPESVGYKCQCCGEIIKESQKYDLNLNGKWIPTAEPVIPDYYSYHLNALVCPVGFITWTDLVKEWLEAVPPDAPVHIGKLKVFMNVRLGLTFEERGESPSTMNIIGNARDYKPSIVPDVLADEDQSGKIVMLSFACDLNGIMERNLEDVRLDWEILAHTANGQTYSVDQGSIGTFKKVRDMNKAERMKDLEREKWTASHGQVNSIWNEVDLLLKKEFDCQSGQKRTIDIAVFDTGFATKFVNQYINSFDGEAFIVGVKGKSDQDVKKIGSDGKAVKKSTESKHLYIVDGNMIKDEIAHNMNLRIGDNDIQPEGFMNFPLPIDGKYQVNSFFKHFESEARKEVVKNGSVVGYSWQKKNSSVQNHFFDCRVYGLASREIFIDIIKKTSSDLRELTWNEFCSWFQ